VYAGHAAIATFTKARRPRLAMALLVPVAFAPDWIEWIANLAGSDNREISHSLVSVAIGATVVALTYWIVVRRTPGAAGDAAALWLTYASHWCADFITGTKPTVPGGPDVGLRLYSHPWADAVLECALIVVCAAAYWRSLPDTARRRWVFWLVPGGLIAAQLIFEMLAQGSWS
jgi:hypothetical protein